MAKQFAVVGLGRFGYAVAKGLERQGQEVLAVDVDEERVEAIKDKVTRVLIADAGEEKTFMSLGLGDMDGLIVAIGEDNLPSAIMVCMLGKEAGVPLVVAKASLDIHGKLFERVGADMVVYPEADMGEHLAYRLAHRHVLEEMALSEDIHMSTMNVPGDWLGKSIEDVNARARHDIYIVAIESGEDGKDVVISPPSSYVFEAGDRMSLVATEKSLQRLEKKYPE